MSELTIKQILFCENYILTRDIKQSSLNAGYSESYSKSKAYELLQDDSAKIGLNRTTMQELDRTQKRSLTGQ